MSGFTEKLHALLTNAENATKKRVAEVEAEVKTVVSPLIAESKKDVAEELATVEGELKDRLTATEERLVALEQKVRDLLPAEVAPTAGSTVPATAPDAAPAQG